MSQNISRRSFIKGLAASAVGLAAGSAFQAPKAIAEGTAAAFIPGTYTSVQTTPYATVEVKCIFSESALTDVSYEVLKTSKADYFTPFANPINSYCQRIVEAGTTEGVDGVTGATLCSSAIRDGVNACKIQALGLTLTTAEKEKLNPQDENFTSFDGDLKEVLSPIKLGSMTSSTTAFCLMVWRLTIWTRPSSRQRSLYPSFTRARPSSATRCALAVWPRPYPIPSSTRRPSRSSTPILSESVSQPSAPNPSGLPSAGNGFTLMVLALLLATAFASLVSIRYPPYLTLLEPA